MFPVSELYDSCETGESSDFGGRVPETVRLQDAPGRATHVNLRIHAKLN